MLLKDGSVLELSRSFMKDPSGKELVVRAKELEPYKAMELTCDLRGRILIAFLVSLSTLAAMWGY